jgi:hypothetical protein
VMTDLLQAHRHIAFLLDIAHCVSWCCDFLVQFYKRSVMSHLLSYDITLMIVCHDRVGTACALYLGGFGFEFWPADWLSRQIFSVVYICTYMHNLR